MEFINHLIQPRLILHGKSLLKVSQRSSLNFRVCLLLVYLLLYHILSQVPYMHLEAQSIVYLTRKLRTSHTTESLNIRPAQVGTGVNILLTSVTTQQMEAIVGSKFHCLD